jgi:hypothetical protein
MQKKIAAIINLWKNLKRQDIVGKLKVMILMTMTQGAYRSKKLKERAQ